MRGSGTVCSTISARGVFAGNDFVDGGIKVGEKGGFEVVFDARELSIAFGGVVNIGVEKEEEQAVA